MLVEWTNEEGAEKQRYVSVVDGKYSAIVTGLKLGTTPVSVTAFDGGDEIGTTSVDVKLEVAPVTATYAFDASVDTVVQVSGTAQPNTRVTIKHGETDLVTVPTGDTGEWTAPINAPNMPGAYNLTVGQEIRGQDNGRIELDVDYGPGVTINSPGDGFELGEGDTLAVRGSAPTGTEINVHEKGKSEVLNSGKAGTNSYLIPITGLEDREYTLVAEGITKGYNRTHAEITINPGKTSELTPAAVTSTSVVAGTTNTIEGTATKDATLKIVNAWGTDLLGTPVTVDSTGHWSFDRAISASAKSFQFKIVQTKGSLTETSALFTLNAEDPAASLVDPTVTGPAAVQLGVNNTFTGTATKDATLKIVNASGTDLLGHPVTVDSDGNWTFDRIVSRSAKNFTFFIEQSKNGATKKSGAFVINPEDPAASLVDPTVTDPATVNLGVNNTFTGTATKDATLKIVNASGTDLLGHPVTVDSDGNWTFDRVVSWNAKNFTFFIEQSKNGATKKSGPFVVNPTAE
ncbi:hypothetical protein DEJ33_07200 [Curtobacterium sp. MCPF17_047]|nr:hypothetical protein DEJ33_07200 [Curtobacterium sp. MCPF17_047]